MMLQWKCTLCSYTGVKEVGKTVEEDGAKEEGGPDNFNGLGSDKAFFLSLRS